MKTRHVALLALLVSVGYSVYTYTPPVTYPGRTYTASAVRSGVAPEGKRPALPRLTTEAPASRPVSGQTARRTKQQTPPTPRYADSLSGRMDRADKMRVPVPTGNVSSVPTYTSGGVIASTSPISAPRYAVSGNHFGSRLLLPLFKVESNNKVAPLRQSNSKARAK